jgi:hypothetical protein
MYSHIHTHKHTYTNNTRMYAHATLLLGYKYMHIHAYTRMHAHIPFNLRSVGPFAVEPFAVKCKPHTFKYVYMHVCIYACSTAMQAAHLRVCTCVWYKYYMYIICIWLAAECKSHTCCYSMCVRHNSRVYVCMYVCTI